VASISALALSSLAAVQLAGATLHGTVTDGATGEPIATATVSLPELHLMALTDASGRYTLARLPPGLQHVEVAHLGYEGRALHAFVPAGGGVELHVALDRRPVPLDEVIVTARPALPELRVSDADPAVDARASSAWFHRDPRSPEPDPLASLTGVGVARSPEVAGGLHVRGGAADHVAFLLNGLPILSPYHAGAAFSAWDPGALASVELSSAFPRPGSTAALAGQVHGETLAPGDRLRTRGALSATQARVSLDAPLPFGAGLLLSVREPFAGLAQGRDEPALLRGDTSDRLLVLHTPLLGGQVRWLLYENDNELNTSAVADGDLQAPDTPPDAPRNRLAWTSATRGASWRRTSSAGRTVEVSAWRADLQAGMVWRGPPDGDGIGTADSVRSGRDDIGASATLHWGGARDSWAAGVRWNRSSTSYVAISEGGEAGLDLRARTPTTLAFVQHTRGLGPGLAVDIGLRAIASGDDPYVAPQLQARWSGGAFALRAAYARTIQFEQSLANAESVAGLIFPAHLFVGAGDDLLPVARGHQWSAAASVMPRDGLTLRASAWTRGARGLVFATPAAGAPFAIDAVDAGTSSADGLGADFAWGTARLTLTGSWAVERVRHRIAESGFVPGYAATHRADLGVNAWLTPTLSVQAAAHLIGGRRTTALLGSFEWESCNLLELGCEFAGSAAVPAEAPGASRLPTYARMDLGVRKHWDVRLGGRPGVIGVFGYATNLFGRTNVLLITEDPDTGERQAVEMRPRAPLSVGVDWRF
jgi:hypothetical protein